MQKVYPSDSQKAATAGFWSRSANVHTATSKEGSGTLTGTMRRRAASGLLANGVVVSAAASGARDGIVDPDLLQRFAVPSVLRTLSTLRPPVDIAVS